MQIKLTCKEIKEYAAEYDKRGLYPDENVKRCMRGVLKRGYMTYANLMNVAAWKNPNSPYYLKENPPEDVKSFTGFALTTKRAFIRVHWLQMLEGVDWEITSTILHFARYSEGYPILDNRTMNTVRDREKTKEVSENYSYEEWEEFTNVCRQKAKKCNVPMRTLDKALWMYDKCGMNE